MPTDVTKLINKLRADYPMLEDEPLLDQIETAAATDEQPPEEQPAADDEAPAEEAAPEEEADDMPPMEDLELPPSFMKRKPKSGGSRGPQYA